MYEYFVNHEMRLIIIEASVYLMASVLNRFQLYFNINKYNMVVVITFGTFDLLHIGHINMLNACKKYGNKLI